MELLIWERGVGRTSSSGTSACAVAAASVREGLVSPGRITVEMEGGCFAVTVTPEMVVRLEGPVELVCAGELAEGLLKALH
jgi:diaminopimelate epimerase